MRNPDPGGTGGRDRFGKSLGGGFQYIRAPFNNQGRPLGPGELASLEARIERLVYGEVLPDDLTELRHLWWELARQGVRLPAQPCRAAGRPPTYSREGAMFEFARMSDRLASAAFRYALRRIAVFPLSSGTKIPIKGSHGLHDASVDSDVARIRWKKHPGANIAAATGSRSGFWVVDIDPGGDKTLARLESEHGPLPPTVEASTPRGRHLYFKWPAGPEIRCSAGRVGPGLDVRGEGGSIVLPPSVLTDGRRYAWARNDACGFAEAPEWLVNLALPAPRPARQEPRLLTGDISRYCASAIAGELVSLTEAKPGQRNDALNLAAFKIGNFVGAGAVPREWAEAELIRCGCSLGLSERAVLATVASGLTAGEKKPRELPQ